ncbi:MAG: nitroreductase family protein [Chloroflexi bacterium B3_Chlor]|nr:MAG: nitroreductase family protein [Chloroflexi bacterium B3_Chlor]
MDFWQVLEGRRSVRSFNGERDVPSEIVTRLLQAAIRAPSAGNCQPWYFFVVRNQSAKRALAQAALNQWFLSEAPVVIVVCAEPERSAIRYGDRGRRLYSLQDTAAAIENLLLAAVASGLGACWVGAFDEEEASLALDLPSHLRPVAIVPVGYPARRPSLSTDRRRLDAVVKEIE